MLHNINLKITTSAAALLLLSPLGFSQSISANAQEQESDVEEIVIVGSRAAGRTALNSTVPIDVFSAEDMAQTPALDMKDALQAASPSFTVERRPSGDGDTFNRPNKMRGLDATEILVLLNGKRVHRSAIIVRRAQAADLSMYSTNSMKSIQVLRDGAAAQYGADAIAGVINMVLKDGEGVSGEVGWGKFFEGDGANYFVTANAGFSLNDNGFFNFTIKHSHADPTNRAGEHLTAKYHRDNKFTGYEDTLFSQPWGISEAERLNLVWNSAYNVSENIEMYFFGNFAKSQIDQPFNYRAALPVGVRDDLGNGSSGAFRATSLVAWDPAGAAHFDPSIHLPVGSEYLEGWSPRGVHPGGFIPFFIYRGTDLGVFGGFRGEFDNGMTWDVSGSVGSNTVEYNLKDSINPSLGAPKGSDGKPLDSAVQTDFYIGELVNIERAIQMDFTYPLEIADFNSANLAFGAEHRTDNFITTPGEQASWTPGPLGDLIVGSNGYQGFSPASAVDASRSNIAVYADLDMEINDRLILGVAARYENFTDFGSSFNWKVSGRFQIIDSIAIRGALSTGFHAPSVGQINSVEVRTDFDAGISTFRGTFPAYHPMAILLGATPLRPEEAKNYSFGIVLTPGDNTNITIDAYQIDLTDRIARSKNFKKTAYASEFQALIDSGFGGASTLNSVRFLTNAFDSRSRGVEVVATHSIDLDAATVNLSLSYAYNQMKVTRAAATQSDRTIFNLENAISPHKATFSATYNLDRLSVTTRARLFTTRRSDRGYKNADGTDFIDENPGRVFFDLSAKYSVTDNITVTAGAYNIFNTYPADKSKTGTFSSRSMVTKGRQYLSSIPWQGGEFYFRLGYSF